MKSSEKTKANPALKNGYLSIANELVEQFALCNIPGNEMRLIWVVMRKTWGWKNGEGKKDEDYIALSQFEKLTGMNRRNVSRGLKDLVAKKLLLKSEGGYYKINQNYKEWALVKRLPRGRGKLGDQLGANLVNTVGVKRLHTKETTTTKETIQKSSARAPSIIALMIEVFKQTNPTLQYGNKSERSACERIVKEIGEDAALAACKAAVRVQGDKYAPIITKPTELERNIGKLRAHVLRQKKPTNKRLTL